MMRGRARSAARRAAGLLAGCGLVLGVGCSRTAPPSPTPGPVSEQPVPIPVPSRATPQADTSRADTADAPSPLPVPPAPPDSLAHPERLTPRSRPHATIRLAFTGDINLGTSTLPDGVPADSGRVLFEQVRHALVGDLVIGNLEGVLADTGTSYKCPPPAPSRRPLGARTRARTPREAPTSPATPPIRCYAFLTPTYLAPRLADAGFTHLNLANNHANDYGPSGRAATETTVHRLGIRTYGPLDRIALDSVRRGDSLTTVALIGFATYPHSYNLLDIGRSVAVVDSMRRLADLVIVTFHGGSEGLAATHVPEAAESLGLEPRGELRRWARAVVDAGADLVVGHGPHVLRGMEFYRRKLIAYSLGNFLTYRGFNLSGALGIAGVLQVELDDGLRLRGARLVAMRQVPGRGVVVDSVGTAIGLVRRLSVEDFGAGAARVADDGGISGP